MIEEPVRGMSDAGRREAARRTRLLVNLGSGTKGGSWLPALFADWREVRVDVDAGVAPDILADIGDLSAIESGSVDAVWAAHCLEHVYLFQVGQAVAEVHRILADDGFFCAIVPDLQAVAEYIASDRLHEVVYESPAGPVIAHDMVFGFGPHLQLGRPSMAHKCGFTPSLFAQKLQSAPFGQIVLRRRGNQELAGLAFKRAPSEAERDALLAALEL